MSADTAKAPVLYGPVCICPSLQLHVCIFSALCLPLFALLLSNTGLCYMQFFPTRGPPWTSV